METKQLVAGSPPSEPALAVRDEAIHRDAHRVDQHGFRSSQRAQLGARPRFLAGVARFWASVAVNATLLLALAPAAHAAFPGRNGFIAYVHASHASEGEEGEGPTTSVRSL